MKITTESAEETKEVGGGISPDFLKEGGVIALSGELGAGKTTFVQGFAKGIGVKDRIISPTFVLMRQHQIPKSEKMLYHVDLYRLEGEVNIDELGLKDLFIDPNSIVIIEWAEKIKNLLPKNTTFIELEKLSENSRSIEVKSFSEN